MGKLHVWAIFFKKKSPWRVVYPLLLVHGGHLVLHQLQGLIQDHLAGHLSTYQTRFSKKKSLNKI